MNSLQSFAEEKLSSLQGRNLRRSPAPTRRVDGLWVERDGCRLLSFCCNDYLGLSHHPAVKAAAVAALEAYGVGAGASRLVTGDHPIIGELEARLAQFKGTEAACVFGSGYLANAGIIPALVGPRDLLVVDELAHACIWAGARLSGAKTIRFRHNDVAHLAEILRDRRHTVDRVLVATDGVFSMDGDLAPLDRLSDVCVAYDAWLMADDAHGVGVVGEGRGAPHAFPGASVPLQMGTLSKAIGGYGGYLCASAAVIDLIKNRARTFVYSTGLPPASAAAALAALEIIEGNPTLCARPIASAQRFTHALGLGDAQSAIVPVVLGGAEVALTASRILRDQGFLVVPIRPPTVAPGTARLRIAFSALHDDEDVDRLAVAVQPMIAA